MHPIIRLLPLTPLIDSLRSIMLQGQSVDSLGRPLTVMTVWAVVSFVLALRWFRWS